MSRVPKTPEEREAARALEAQIEAHRRESHLTDADPTPPGGTEFEGVTPLLLTKVISPGKPASSSLRPTAPEPRPRPSAPRPVLPPEPLPPLGKGFASSPSVTFATTVLGLTELDDDQPLPPKRLKLLFRQIDTLRENFMKRDALLRELEKELVERLEPPPRLIIDSVMHKHIRCGKCMRLLLPGDAALVFEMRYWHASPC